MKIFNWIFSSFFRTLGRFLFYIAVGFIAMLFISGKVNAASIVTDTNTIYEGKWQGNSNGNPGYVILYDGISGATSNFKHGTFPFIYVSNIFMSVIGASANQSVSYIAEVQICQTTNDYTLNYDSGSVHTQISNVEKLRSFNSGTCSINVYTGNLVTYYFLVTGNVVAYSNPDSNYGFDEQSYVLRWTSNNYIEFSIKDVVFTPYTTDLYNSILQSNSLDSIQQAIEEQNQEMNNKLDTQINQNQTIIDQNTQTNEKLDDLNDNLTSTEGADLGALENSAGWLPAGPVDSILNLPLSLLNNLTTNLNKSCQPVILPIPYVNKDLTLPCVNTLYDDMGISGWVTTIGVIASAFIMLSYLLKLYKWVDDTLSFRENNSIDNWGGI